MHSPVVLLFFAACICPASARLLLICAMATTLLTLLGRDGADPMSGDALTRS